jgi:hypothetical protein
VVRAVTVQMKDANEASKRAAVFSRYLARSRSASRRTSDSVKRESIEYPSINSFPVCDASKGSASLKWARSRSVAASEMTARLTQYGCRMMTKRGAAFPDTPWRIAETDHHHQHARRFKLIEHSNRPQKYVQEITYIDRRGRERPMMVSAGCPHSRVDEAA